MTGCRIFRLLAAGAVLIPALTGAQAAAVPAADTATGAGYRLTFAGTTTTTGMVSGSVPSQQQTYKLRMLDGIVRTDPMADVNPMFRKGMYLLHDARTGATTVVDTAARSTWIMNAMESLAAMPGGGEITIADTSSQLEDLGPGETVLGFATRKYRFTMRYEMRMAMMGTSMSIRMASIATLQMNQEVGANDPAFDALRDRMMQSSAPAAGSRAAAQLTALAKSMPNGFAMIADQEMRMDMSGSENVIRQTLRVTEFARGGVKASDMQVPAGYTTVDMNAMMKRALEAVEAEVPPPHL